MSSILLTQKTTVICFKLSQAILTFKSGPPIKTYPLTQTHSKLNDPQQPSFNPYNRPNKYSPKLNTQLFHLHFLQLSGMKSLDSNSYHEVTMYKWIIFKWMRKICYWKLKSTVTKHFGLENSRLPTNAISWIFA